MHFMDHHDMYLAGLLDILTLLNVNNAMECIDYQNSCIAAPKYTYMNTALLDIKPILFPYHFGSTERQYWLISRLPCRHKKHHKQLDH